MWLAKNNYVLVKLGSTWNSGEIGVQLNNDPGNVLAAKDSKDVHVATIGKAFDTTGHTYT